MASSNGRPHADRPRPTVPGNILPDGSIRCTCGKKVGAAHETQVEFHCPGCNVGVVVDSAVLILRNCEKALDMTSSIIALMQSLQPSPQAETPAC